MLPLVTGQQACMRMGTGSTAAWQCCSRAGGLITYLHNREGDGGALSTQSQQSHEAALGQHILPAELCALQECCIVCCPLLQALQPHPLGGW